METGSETPGKYQITRQVNRMNSQQFYTRFHAAVLILLLTSCGLRAQSSSTAPFQGYEYQFPAMGTLVQLKAYAPSDQQAERLFKAAEARVQAISAVLTDYNSKSETRQLTSRAHDHFVSVSPDLWKVLSASDHWHNLSSGTFDSSLGQLTTLWRKYRRAKPKNPPRESIEKALAESGWGHVELDCEKQSIRIDAPNIRLDFGGIGKGYAVDEAYKILQDGGLTRCLVNMSGNMRFGDPPPERDCWRIEIAPVGQGGKPLRRISVSNTSIATSGDLWQFTVVDGQRRSHILDPRTGLGVPGPISATVLAATATDADAMATIATILDEETLRALHAKHPKYAILVARKEQTQTSEQSALQVKIYGRFPDDKR